MPNLRSIAIAILLISGMSIGISSLYGNVFSNYLSSSTTSLSNLDQITETNEIINDFGDSIQSQTLSPISLIGTVLFTPVKLFFQTISIFEVMATNMIEILRLPSWFLQIIIGAFSITVFLEVTSALLLRKL